MINKNDIKVLKIEKLVAEYIVWELYISPYAKFKVRIFHDGKLYIGRSNIMVIDQEGVFNHITGSANTIEEALEQTINHFFKMTEWKKEWNEEDFEWTDPNKF